MQEAQETQVWSLGQEDPLEEGMATLSSILAWEIPCTEEPEGLQFVGSKKSDTRINFICAYIGLNLSLYQLQQKSLLSIFIVLKLWSNA